jgi:hypothetical protein
MGKELRLSNVGPMFDDLGDVSPGIPNGVGVNLELTLASVRQADRLFPFVALAGAKNFLYMTLVLRP